MLIICDIGSLHLNNQSRIVQHLDEAKRIGLWAVKFQLFRTSTKNLVLDIDNWEFAKQYAQSLNLTCFASVFSMEEIPLLKNCQYCKIAYSQRHRQDLIDEARKNYKTIVTCDLLDDVRCDYKLWTGGYPWLYKPDFNNLLDFDGISYHGSKTNLLDGCQIFDFVEIHSRLGFYDEEIWPDSKIALTYKDIDKWIQSL